MKKIQFPGNCSEIDQNTMLISLLYKCISIPSICLYMLSIELLVKRAVAAESLCKGSCKQNAMTEISWSGMRGAVAFTFSIPGVHAYTGYILHVASMQLVLEGDGCIPDFCDQQRTKSSYTEQENIPHVCQSSYSNAVTKQVLENGGVNVCRHFDSGNRCLSMSLRS